MTPELAASYDHCQRIARKTARNFYYAFLPLAKPRRLAMGALYAFLRKSDDLVDDEGLVDRRGALARWRQSLTDALAGTRFDDPLLPALAHTVATYRIPREYLFEALDGMEMDLDVHEYATFADLEAYCYRVASVVGLSCIHIWGFRGPEALEPARQCGVAFQLTNILRDLKEDAERGRIYLPLEDLARFDYTVEDLRASVRDERFRALMQFEIGRAEQLYREGAALYAWLEPAGQPAFEAMVALYHGLLGEIQRADGDVFQRRIRLSSWRKLRIAAGSLLGVRGEKSLRVLLAPPIMARA